MADQPSPLLTCGSDVLLRVMEFLGPRHSCIGLGATCRELHRLSRDDALWRLFWMARCLYSSPGENVAVEGGEGSVAGGGDEEVHGAAWVFRHAIHEMGLDDKLRSHLQRKGIASVQSDSNSPQSDDAGTTLYSAYVQKHVSMKLNLRVERHKSRLINYCGRLRDADLDLEHSTLSRPECTQTWPGQLSLVVDEAIANTGHNRRRVTCLNPAEAFCDDPSCNRARCGPSGCLRCYRFLPRDYSLSASQMARECSDRDYEMVISFVKCSWCSVSYCSEHIASPWYSCDECQLSSCPDCVSQVFVTSPNIDRCNVQTAGKMCQRKVCRECTWHVGRRRENFARNIPGGDYSQGNESTIVTVKGSQARDDNAHEWEEVETSCGKCLRHVEFRWRELAQVQESFGGFMP